ncbi:MAG: MerR family transcriptional regulator [Thermomicrobiales bacterium]
MEQGEYTLNDLTELAGVSSRTVRYYISEGLLPPPESAGPRTTYSQTHLDRLLLIGRLKDAYLPLREIRRQLNDMSDQEVAKALAEHSTDADPAARHLAEDSDDAARYLRRILADQHPASRAQDAHRRGDTAAGFVPDPGSRFAALAESRSFMKRDHDLDALPDSGTSWRRIELGPDAELLVREDAYERNRDRIEWLITWANRVFR